MKRILFLCSLSFLLGILTQSVGGTVLFKTVLSVLIILIACIFLFLKTKRSALRGLLYLMFFILGAGTMLFYEAEERKTVESVSESDSAVLFVTGCTDSGFTGELAESSVFTFYLKVPVSDCSNLPEPGTLVSVTGYFSEFSEPENPGQFDYKAYQNEQGILGELKYASYTVRKPPGIFHRMLNSVRSYVSNTFESVLPEDAAGFLEALFLSERENLSDSLKSDFSILGISHILAISGMHITILTGIFGTVLARRLRKKYAGMISVVFLLIFGSLCGFSVSIVRALGLYLISVAADFLGRRNDSVTSLFLVLMLVLFRRPTAIFSESVILSYGASFIFFVCIPAMNRKRKETSGKIIPDTASHPIREMLLLQLLMLPVLASFKYTFCPYSIVLNLILIPMLPLVFLYGFGILVFSFLTPNLSAFLALGYLTFYNGMRILTNLFRKLPLSVIVTGKPHPAGIILFYSISCILLLRAYFSGYKRILLPILVSSVVFLFHFHTGTEIRNLSVGQGDCTVLLSDTHAMIIDCGSTTRDAVGSNYLLPYLYCNGISSVDYVILSHGDLDHYSGLAELAGEIKIRRFLSLSIPENEKLESLNSVWSIPKAGDEFSWCEFSGTFLWPASDAVFSEDDSNNNGLVLLLENGSFKGLFTGDIDKTVFQTVSEAVGTNITYLKVPHHGSKYSASPEALSVLMPEISVISVGSTNTYGHPHTDTLEAYQKLQLPVYRTDRMGSVGFSINEFGGLSFIDK